jgi:site-specific DNA-cytosine methylase
MYGEQTSLFSGTQRFVIDKPIRLIELFAGIGSQAKALRNIGADFEHLFYKATEDCEIYYIKVKDKNIGLIKQDENWFAIRKLTPKECWRLMGFFDKDFYAAQSAGVSDSQLYKQAGNSIVVNVLEAIFKQLF